LLAEVVRGAGVQQLEPGAQMSPEWDCVWAGASGVAQWCNTRAGAMATRASIDATISVFMSLVYGTPYRSGRLSRPWCADSQSWYPAGVDWAERLSLVGVLGAALLAVARAYVMKDAALAASQQARIDDLKDIVGRARHRD